MKSITKIEKDGYILVNNPDLVPEYKFNLSNYAIGSGERALYFGELQIYNTLKVEGELNVLSGTLYSYNLGSSITSDTTIYGVINVTDEINIGGILTVI
jgi:hypothetical protein